ncbi:MAG TPA: thiol-disulfide isomerase [Blastocatellia bacterium]|nr:thiol-disulfide isomerase [Blastocatellia bacterium]
MRLLKVGAVTLGMFTVLVAAVSANGPSKTSATFTRDVAPILFNKCIECHRAGEIAPMSLLSYQEVRPWAKSIRQRVVERSMPPWSADPHYGKFSNDPSLSQKEIDTIVSWVDAGAPKGDDLDMPPTPKFVQGWTIGKPDVVLSMQEEYAVPADGTIPYLYFTIPTGFKEDKWIQAMEIKPGNRGVVHHVIAFTQDPGTGRRGGGGGEAQQGRGQLGGITPNKTGVTFAPGTARLIKAGSNIVFQMHYTTNGEATRDRTSIGLVFAKEPPTKTVVTGNAMNTRFVIPAGEANHEVKSSTTFKEDVHITSFMPHMHFRGKDFVYTAVYPDGRSEILLQVPKYDFNWQLTYVLEKPIALPKGSRLDCVAHFDNSTKNKFNPDPTKEVRWGDQTWEEMMIGWFAYTRDSEQRETALAKPSSGK